MEQNIKLETWKIGIVQWTDLESAPNGAVSFFLSSYFDQ